MPSLPFKDPVLVFALLMLILLVAPAASARLRLPGVVGLIAAGAIVGPSALGLLERSQVLETLRSLGLLYLMFLAGLSLDFAQFKALRNRSLGFGLASFIIPQVLAVVVGLHLLDMGWLAALLLGSICGTHTLVGLPVAQRLGLGRNPAVTVVAGGTLVCDGLGLGVLAAVGGAASGAAGAGFWALFVAKLAVFLAGVVFVLPRFARLVFRRVPLQPAGELTFLLLVLFGTAWLAELAGLAPIIGAFLAGLVLNRMVPAASGIMGRVAFVGDALFVPFFLVGVGLLVDFGVLAHSTEVWWLATVFVALVVIGKGAAALGAARWFGHSRATALVMVGLSIPQAAGTLAVTLVGFELKLFDETVVNAVVMLILITCLVGPWLVDRAARRAALEETGAGARDDEGAGRVLIPLANPATAGALVDIAILLRDEGATDPIHPLTIVRDGRGVEEQVAKNERLLGEAVLHAVAAGAPVQPATRVDMNAVHGIVRAAKELRTSIVVIGWSGEATAGDRIFGTVLDQLLDQCSQMVLVCKTAAPLAGTERLLVIAPPLAGREEGFERAAHAIKALARNMDAALVVLAHPNDHTRLEARLRAIRPAMPFVVQSLEALEELQDTEITRDRLAGHVQPNDLLVVLSARRDALAWRADLARLPAHLSAAFPAHSLITVHKAQVETSDEARESGVVSSSGLHAPLADSALHETPELLRELPAVQAVLQHDAEPLAAFVRHLIEPSLSDLSKVQDVSARLLRIAHEHPAEVRPGVLFLHAHAAAWDEPRIFVGTCADGLSAPNLPHPVRVVVALVSPEGQRPEEHLRNLALVASAFLACDSVERLSQARTLDELKGLLDQSPV